MTPTRTPNRPREATMLNISFLFALDVDRYRVKPNKPYHRQAISNLGRHYALSTANTPTRTTAAHQHARQQHGLNKSEDYSESRSKSKRTINTTRTRTTRKRQEQQDQAGEQEQEGELALEQEL